jgi:putative membrane protein
MVIELLLFVLLGCILGIIAGLIPGLHANTIAVLAVGFAATNNLGFVLMLAAMSVTQSFVDFVPSILLGAPDSESFLSVLPGHRLLLQGKGFIAIRMTIVGGLAAGLAAIAIAPIFILFTEKSKQFLTTIIPFVLIAVLAIMIWGEKGKQKKAWACAIIALSGVLGLIALRSSFSLQNSLFCLSTGFFGSSTLIYSIRQKQCMVEQHIGEFFIEKSRLLRSSVLALVGAAIVSLMPAIGSNQAAFIIRKFVGKIKTADYLLLLGGVNTATMILSFFVLFAWGKTRTGSAAAMKQIMPFGSEELLYVIAASLIALGIAAIATDLIAKKALKKIHLIDYKKINSIVLVFLTAMVAIFSGFTGIIFYITATAIGLLILSTDTRRTNSMAFLMIPTILFYLGF